MLELRRYVSPITSDQLASLLMTPDAVQTTPTDLHVDFATVREVLTELPRSGTTDRERATWDRMLVEPLHQALRALPRREAADMRFWHWMCIQVLPDFVWARWYGAVPERDEIVGLLNSHPALVERFLGTASLRGVSRNALARLWWCAQALSAGGTDYAMAREALTNQDLFQAVFERKLGLYPPTARVLVRLLLRESEDRRRAAIKRLNHYFTTIVQEALEEEDIERLLAL